MYLQSLEVMMQTIIIKSHTHGTTSSRFEPTLKSSICYQLLVLSTKPEHFFIIGSF